MMSFAVLANRGNFRLAVGTFQGNVCSRQEWHLLGKQLRERGRQFTADDAA